MIAEGFARAHFRAESDARVAALAAALEAGRHVLRVNKWCAVNGFFGAIKSDASVDQYTAQRAFDILRDGGEMEWHPHKGVRLIVKELPVPA